MTAKVLYLRYYVTTWRHILSISIQTKNWLFSGRFPRHAHNIPPHFMDLVLWLNNLHDNNVIWQQIIHPMPNYTKQWNVPQIYVSLRLRVQNWRNFPLNFHTMRKLSDLYSGIFQTQSSGCVSGLDHFRNFTNLKILNI